MSEPEEPHPVGAKSVVRVPNNDAVSDLSSSSLAASPSNIPEDPRPIASVSSPPVVTFSSIPSTSSSGVLFPSSGHEVVHTMLNQRELPSVNAQDALQVSRFNALLLLKMKAYEQCGREWKAQFYAVDLQIRNESAEHELRYQRYEERLRM